MTEGALVVRNREHLWYLLAEAAQLEHMIMCQYLYAAFSLKQSTDEGLTEEQLAAVERWRKLLNGIAVQEMVHLSLVANVMVAIGAAPPFGRPNFPQRSGYFPSGVQLDLLPFGDAALRHFLFLERPEGMERADADGFEPAAPQRLPVDPEEIMPRGQEFATVGHLYRGIEAGLRTLCEQCGESGLFVGSPRAQATPELFGGWKEIIPVTDLSSALAAIGEIIEQGEGARGDWQDAHYGRFLRMWDEYTALRAADPDFEPARPVLMAFTRQPFDSAAPQTLIADTVAHTVGDLFTLGYELVLHTLLRFFTHTDEDDAQLGTLLDVAIGLMSGVVGPLGRQLARMPVGPEHPGRTVGAAFEMHYIMTNLVPYRPGAWALLAERTQMLADRSRAAATGADDAELTRIAELADGFAARLRG